MTPAQSALRSYNNVFTDHEKAIVLNDQLPCHIAVIMDGNGRWAIQQGLPRLVGHYRGAEVLRKTIQSCIDIGIKYLTVYAFSTENWRRPQDEINGLMGLLKRYLKKELAEIHSHNIRVRVIGERSRTHPDITSLIDHAVTLTQNNTALNLTLAFDYGGRDDIVKATRKIAENVRLGLIKSDDINEQMIVSALLTHDLPDPDLMIRTANTSRISNFLLWQQAYTELVFMDVYWPDFNKDHLLGAIKHYQNCERKFGKISV